MVVVAVAVEAVAVAEEEAGEGANRQQADDTALIIAIATLILTGEEEARPISVKNHWTTQKLQRNITVS